MERQHIVNLAIAGIVAIGLAAAGYFAGQGLVESRLGFRTVTVKGLAEKEVKADLGFWPIAFSASGPSLEDARQSLVASEQAVKAFLRAKGFSDTDMQVQAIQVRDRQTDAYQSGGPFNARFVLSETILVRTEDVDRLAAAARDIGGLLEAGVVFSGDSYSGGPSYSFTGLNDMKGELLEESTKRALEAAEEFADQSGARVGPIQTANQGIISIGPAAHVPNANPDSQIDKRVRVVSTITYFLK